MSTSDEVTQAAMSPSSTVIRLYRSPMSEVLLPTLVLSVSMYPFSVLPCAALSAAVVEVDVRLFTTVTAAGMVGLFVRSL